METYLHTGIKVKVVEEIKSLAKEHCVKKILLFGSRARGDFKERSDIDLAVYGGNVDLFSVAVDEETSTLLKYDIVNMDVSIQEELLQSINEEGIVLYEKV